MGRFKNIDLNNQTVDSGGESDDEGEQCRLLTEEQNKSAEIQTNNVGEIPKINRNEGEKIAQVVLYQSVEDGSVALKGDAVPHLAQFQCKADYSDSEILSGVSFHLSYLGSTPVSTIKQQVDDVRASQAREAIESIACNQPSNSVIMTVSHTQVRVYDGAMQQLLMDHPVKSISYVGEQDRHLVLMVRLGDSQEPGVTFKTTCHVFQSPNAHLVRDAVNRAFTLAYDEILRKSGSSGERLLQSAYSEVLSSQTRTQADMMRVLDPAQHVLVSIIKRPQEGLGLSLIPAGPGSLIPTVLVSGIRPGSPAYKTEMLNVGDQILEVNGRSLCAVSFDETISYVKSLLPTTKLELKVVSGSPVLEFQLVRPDLKYPLGFSVKDGHITTLVRGSIGERAGIRIGHRIIAINGESTVTADHDTIAGILLSETGKLVIKTTPSQIYYFMLGIDTPTFI